MSELKYRVKIIEKNDGTKLYVPQVGEPKLSIGKFDHLWMDWRDIISENYGIDGFNKPSKNRTYYYDSEDIAIDLKGLSFTLPYIAISIEKRYKQHLIEQDLKKDKSITYKEL